MQDVICTGRHLYRTSFVQDVICTVRLCVSTDTPNRCCGWILSLSYQSVRACLQMHEMQVCRPIDKLSLRTRARTPYPRHTPALLRGVCCTALHCTALSLVRSFTRSGALAAPYTADCGGYTGVRLHTLACCRLSCRRLLGMYR